MRLSRIEFLAMNNPVRRFVQKHLEFRVFRHMGLNDRGSRILEIGCGSGYGAKLLAMLEPESYHGIDLMPEQIEIAKSLGVTNVDFAVGDAADLSRFADDSQDVVVVFGILHHIPAWRQVVTEIGRVLPVGGKLFIEEPSTNTIRFWDKLFHWGHPHEDMFSLAQLETFMEQSGMRIIKKHRFFGLGTYYVQKIAY